MRNGDGTSPIVSISGLYASGVSALRDALKDNRAVAVFPTEFRLCKETFGLFNLRQELGRSRSAEVNDLALRNFLWLTNNLGASGRLRLLQRPGHSYDLFTKGVFSGATCRFVDALTEYRYPMDWHFYDFLKPEYKFWWDIVRKRIFGQSVEQDARMVFADDQRFVSSAQTYLRENFDGALKYLEMPPTSPLFLHNLINAPSLREIGLAEDLIPGVKFVVVDRDPRDVFLDIPFKRYLPDAKPLEKAKRFLDFHRYLREEMSLVSERRNVMPISFESLVESPRETLGDVFEFCGLSASNVPKGFGPDFRPEISRERVGMWKRIQEKDVSDAVIMISQELGLP